MVRDECLVYNPLPTNQGADSLEKVKTLTPPQYTSDLMINSSAPRLRNLILCLLSVLAYSSQTNAQSKPILISESESTRAIAFESISFTAEPFPLDSLISWSPDRRTRVMLFALSIAPHSDLSGIIADAEDVNHKTYSLKVESVVPVPGQEWMSSIIVRLSDEMGDVGDVLVRVVQNGQASNRVRIAIGHKGGGPPDDAGSGPTPAPPYRISGKVTSAGVGLSNVEVAMTGSQTLVAQTDNNGFYSFTVATFGNYSIIPLHTQYLFAPAATNLTNLAGNRSDINFVGDPRKYRISGRVTEATTGVANVTVTLSGTASGIITTDSNGNYAFADLPAGGNYNVTLSRTNYTFSPPQRSVVNLASDQSLHFAASRNLFTIRGRITDGPGAAIASATVTISGDSNSSNQTDANGFYSFSVPAEGNYTVTPSKSLHVFNPQSRAITNLTKNETDVNFEGTLQTFVISGRVTNESGAVIGGQLSVTLNLSGSQTGTTVSDNNGNYSFTLLAGGNYTITPQTNAHYSFSTAASFTTLSGNQTVHFMGTLRRYTISGRILHGANGLGGVGIALAGTTAGNTTTDSNGNYSFGDLPAGGTFAVLPTKNNYNFNPAEPKIDVLLANQTINFAASLNLYTISGRVTNSQGAGVTGVTMSVSGSLSIATQTDSNGNYSFTVPAEGTYTVTPSKPFHVFNPASRTFTNISGNQNEDFSGEILNFGISGKIIDDQGAGLLGITVTLTGSQTKTTLTLPDGSYSFLVPATGNYTITPSLEGDYYAFAPAVHAFNNLDGHKVATDITATLTPLPDVQHVLEFDGTPKMAAYGFYWRPLVDLGHFFWEFWAMPGNDASGRYLLADGYGGGHALLFGFGHLDEFESGRYVLSGNVYDGVQINSFSSDEGPAPGEWGHYAVGWDGQHIITYFNGVPVGKTRFTGPRRTPGPGGGGSWLMIGGSDHSNLDGRIAQVRGYDGANPREHVSSGSVETGFRPQTVFGTDANFGTYFFRPTMNPPDLSKGYEGNSHPGLLRSTKNGVLKDCSTPDCPLPLYVIDPTAPNFKTATPPRQIVLTSPATVPPGALVFDSFSRNNSTYVFGALGGLGTTEGGSIGTRSWQTNVPAGEAQPFGILNGRAVILGNAASLAWVDTSSLTGDLDIRVERRASVSAAGQNTGLAFRIVDASNYFFAYSSENSEPTQPKRLNVGYYQGGQRTNLAANVLMPASWTTLKVITTSAGPIEVYADGTLVFSGNTSLFSASSRAGIYNNGPGLGLTNRWDNFTVLPAVP